MYARTSEDVDGDEEAELRRLESGADHNVQKQNATGQQKLPAAQQHQREKQVDSAELMRSGITSGSLKTLRSGGTVSSRKYSIIQNAGLSPAGQTALLSTMQAAGSSALSSTFEERSTRGAAILTRSMDPSDAFLYAESLRASKRQALLPAALAVEEDATARMQDLLLGEGQPPARQAESPSMPRAASRDPAPASVGGGLASMLFESLGDEARRIIAETGWLDDTTRLGRLAPLQRSEVNIAMLGKLLRSGRANGGSKATVAARPDLSVFGNKLLHKLMGAGLINTCDLEPLCAFNFDSIPFAIFEDWKPPGPYDVTPATRDELLAIHSCDDLSTKPLYHARGLRALPHLASYYVEAEECEARMSTTGMLGDTSVAEMTRATGNRYHIMDVVLGQHRDAHVHPHIVPDYEALVSKYFGPLCYHAVLDNPEYLVVNFQPAGYSRPEAQPLCSRYLILVASVFTYEYSAIRVRVHTQ